MAPKSPLKITVKTNEVCGEIWYHLYNLKTEKNTHGGVLHLVKLQGSVCLSLMPVIKYSFRKT